MVMDLMNVKVSSFFGNGNRRLMTGGRTGKYFI
jgi:hypothetical protein